MKKNINLNTCGAALQLQQQHKQQQKLKTFLSQKQITILRDSGGAGLLAAVEKANNSISSKRA